MIFRILYRFIATCGMALVAIATYLLLGGQAVTTALIVLGCGVVVTVLSLWCLLDEGKEN